VVRENPRVALGPYQLTASELSAVLAADRNAVPYLAYRAGDARLVLHPLDGDVVTIGRAVENDVTLDWDPEVSRSHARLERVAARWTVVDDGLSRNGTFVGPERLSGRRALEPGDLVRVGRTTLVVRAPALQAVETLQAVDTADAARLTPAELRVLVALCRPWAGASGGLASPASNQEIADELVLSIPGVKTHLRSLFEKLGVEDLPQNRKRAELARRALATGVVRPADL
jgi:pSer/pThr/pTyr-binding forkhead associated (FHA) protein